MPFGTTAALVTAGALAAGGSVASAGIGASAAGSAADAQAQEAERALEFEKQIYGETQGQFGPYRQLGNWSVGQLGDLMSTGGFPDWTGQFTPPTSATEQNDPGFQFRLQQGQKLLENSAAARGSLLTGATAKGLQQYGQDYASNEYEKVYGRSLGQYLQKYQEFLNNQSNKFGRYMTLADLGEQATAAGASLANQSAGQVGNTYGQIGGARAAGMVGGANPWSGALSNLSQLPFQYYLASQYLGPQGVDLSGIPQGGAITGMDSFLTSYGSGYS